MKKLTSLAAALALTCTLVTPALAAPSTDQRLTDVTAQIKQALDLDTDRYTAFYGDLDDNPLASTWDLEWSDGEGASMSINATEEGKVLTYSLYDRTAPSQPSGPFSPSFPAGDRETAKAAALAFLDRVLVQGETAQLKEDNGPLPLNTEFFRFRGEILVNGLSAGLSFSVTVRCSDNQVTYFYRDNFAGMVMGGIPSPTPSATAAQAASALRGTLSLRLEYVRPDDESGRAVLRWLPNWGDDYYVDAASGALVNLSELYDKASDKGLGTSGGSGLASNDAIAEDVPSSPSLSPAEQEGIAKLEGVLDREALDAAARRISALGLDQYSLASASYTADRETEEGTETAVTALLRYGKQVEGYTWRRNVTLDARTGALLSVSSSGRLPDGAQLAVDFEQAQTKAEAFLKEQAPGQFARTALYDSTEAGGQWSWSHCFTYAQKENGFFFPENFLELGIDATDGSISDYAPRFDDGVTFDSTEGICSAGEAVDAWLATYETKLQYIMVPAAIDFSKPEYAPLDGSGLSYLYELALGYQLTRDTSPLGIDAKTCQPVYWDQKSSQTSLTYSDLAGHWAQEQIEKLALYGVGYAGGSFQPGKALTQADLVALLVSTQGYLYQPEEEGSADYMYEMAYDLGILTREERNDSAALTRAETVRLLLDAAGYGPVARLEGIFRTSFADDGDIPASYYGYAALAQGLGIASGAPGSRFLPNAGATRAEAAAMLYRLMSR